MAYADKTTGAMEVMAKNFGALAKEIKALEKTKPLPKDKIKTLKTELDRKGKVMGAKLDELIVASQKDFLKHAALVDKAMADAVAALKTAKAALAKFDPKAPDPKLLMAVTRPNLADKVKALHEAVETDASQFGASWFKVRQYSTGSAAGDEIKPYIKGFYEKRVNLMGQGKGTDAKVDKLADIAKEITVLINELRAGFTGGGVAPKDAEEGIKEVTDDIETWSKKSRAKYDAVLRQVTGFTKTLGELKTPEMLHAEQLAASAREGLATIKAFKSSMDLHGKKLAQAKKMFGGVSKTGDGLIKTQEEALKGWLDELKTLQDAVVAATKVVPKIQAKVKKAA